MSRPPHSLVIGGTGMLRGVCLELARRGHHVSVVARRHAPLSSLCDEASGLSGQVLPAPADYASNEELAARIRAQTIAHGPVELAVCWIHDTAPSAIGLIAKMIADPRRPARLIHILGSAAADPVRIEPDDPATRIAGVDYQRVILGFVPGPRGSRWLTNEEICTGVLSAIDSRAAESIVGAVHPWSARPSGTLNRLDRSSRTAR